MCGILGSIGFIPDQETRLEADGLLQERGPDAGGEWIDPSIPVWLFHRRLSILDLSERGAQPMVHPEIPDIVVTYNGEIYNYRALRSLLEGKGYVFRSDSDTELLLHAYVAWDVELLSRIEGMFAFAIWDGGRRSIFLARDPIGQKPLFYASFNNRLVFGSTTQALRCIDPTPGILSYEALCYVLTLGYVPSPHAIWANMHCLDPGHYLVWEPGRVTGPKAYWQPPEVLNRESGDSEEFVSIFTGICEEHLLADVPVGLLLSAGLDSSCVAALLAHSGKQDFTTFSLHFVGDRLSEAPVAQETSRHLGLKNITVNLDQDDVYALRESVAMHASQPQGYSALLSWYRLSREVSGYFKTAISADGGDELFGGYRWYTCSRFGSAQFKRFLKVLLSRDVLFHKFYEFSKKSVLHAHALKVFPRFLPEEAASLFAPIGKGFDDEMMLEPMRRHWIEQLPRQNALQRVDLMTFCSGSICAKTDEMSMAHSLEIRAPFLDRRMIEWALSRPTPLYREGKNKEIIRKAILGKVPEGVLSHPKQGFSMKGLKSHVFESLFNEIRESSLFVDGILSENFEEVVRKKSVFHQARLWTLAAISKWYENNAVYGQI